VRVLARQNASFSRATQLNRGNRQPLANETLYQLSYTPILPLKNGSLKSGKNFVSPPLLSTTILLRLNYLAVCKPRRRGNNTRPKNQAFVLVALDVASAEDFKISKSKISRTSRSGVGPGFSAAHPIMDVERLPRRRFCEGGLSI
jgi:hypothetical protein